MTSPPPDLTRWTPSSIAGCGVLVLVVAAIVIGVVQASQPPTECEIAENALIKSNDDSLSVAEQEMWERQYVLHRDACETE
ncbi:hypothetical protein [Agromyces sp. NPDC055661]